MRKDAIRASIGRLQQILHWFHSQQQLAFYASSLLFVYEGLPSSLSSASISSFLSSPSISDALMKTANLLLVGDGGQSQEEKASQEEAGRENKMAEYNNNTEVVVSWDSSISTGHTNHRKDGDNPRLRAYPHLHRVDDVAADSADHEPPLTEEDNTCQRKDEQKLSPNGNRNMDGERAKMDRTEEEEEGQRGTDGDTAVEVRMIDFAHVFPSDSLDQGYIYGLKHLLTVLEQILCDAAHSSLFSPTS